MRKFWIPALPGGDLNPAPGNKPYQFLFIRYQTAAGITDQLPENNQETQF